MEEERGEWEIVEEKGGGDGKMSLILNKGWGVGKKIMITGVVISSAPIVLPPLVVFSTIGFAFAVPFGVLFASYACADKLMSKLLSRPPTEDDDSEEGLQMVGGEGEVGYVEGEKAKPVEDARREEEGDEEHLEENIGGENEQTVEDETKKEEEQVDEGKERKSEVGIGEQEKKASENVQINVEGNKEQENGVVRVEEDKSVDDKKAKTEEITSDSEPKQGSSEVSSSAMEEHSTGRPVRGPAGSKTAKRTRKNKTAAVSSKEAYSEEKKIWEQIDALRKILGYKIAPQVNSMEEVKALYVFTGVEPPSNFKDPLDLVDVSDKLQLLMSIVGVK